MNTKKVRAKKTSARPGAPPASQFVLLIPNHQMFSKRKDVFSVVFLPDGRHLFESPDVAQAAAKEFLDQVAPFSPRFQQHGVVVVETREGEGFIDRPYAEVKGGVAVQMTARH